MSGNFELTQMWQPCLLMLLFSTLMLLFSTGLISEKLVQVLEKMKWEAAMRIQDPSSNLRGEKVAVKLDKLIKRYLSE